MKQKKRLVPDWPFPAYIFIPGENPHPKKVTGHMEGESEPVSPPIDLLHPEHNRFLRFALDLYNHGYFWESHVYFEALWNAHHRKGPVADFLKGMIKLGAAGVKLNLKQQLAASGHLERAKELFSALEAAQGEIFLGFNLKDILHNIETEGPSLQIYPEWE